MNKDEYTKSLEEQNVKLSKLLDEALVGWKLSIDEIHKIHAMTVGLANKFREEDKG